MWHQLSGSLGSNWARKTSSTWDGSAGTCLYALEKSLDQLRILDEGNFLAAVVISATRASASVGRCEKTDPAVAKELAALKKENESLKAAAKGLKGKAEAVAVALVYASRWRTFSMVRVRGPLASGPGARSPVAVALERLKPH